MQTNPVNNFNDIGRDLESILCLRFAPIAFKLLENETDVPEGCVRAVSDLGKQLNMCQAFAYVRRNRKSLVMFRDDHWCVWPLVSFKYAEMDDDAYDTMGTKLFLQDPEIGKKYIREKFPVLNRDTAGFAIAPLASCTFEPDIVVIYCIPSQLRHLLMAAKYSTGKIVESSLDTVGSCVHATIPVLNGEKDYNLSIPDPGEYERSLAYEEEMIFTFSAAKAAELYENVVKIADAGFGYRQLAFDMNLEFPRPDFYNKMFEKCGLIKES